MQAAVIMNIQGQIGYLTLLNVILLTTRSLVNLKVVLDSGLLRFQFGFQIK